MKTIGQTIKAWRTYRGISQSQLAEMSGLSQNSIGQYERELTSPSHHQLVKLAEGLDVSMIEFMSGPPGSRRPGDPLPEVSILRENDTDRPRSVHTVAVPFYESIPAGGWESVQPAEVGEKEVLRHLVNHDGYVVVRVNGMSMYPRILDGDLILVDTKRTKPKSGETVVALYQGATTLKRYRIINRTPALTADNPEYPPLEISNPADLVVLGVVVRLIDRDMGKAVI